MKNLGLAPVYRVSPLQPGMWQVYLTIKLYIFISNILYFFALKFHYGHLVWSINLEFEETVWLACRYILLDNRFGCLAFLMDWPVYQIHKNNLIQFFWYFAMATFSKKVLKRNSILADWIWNSSTKWLKSIPRRGASLRILFKENWEFLSSWNHSVYPNVQKRDEKIFGFTGFCLWWAQIQ